MHRLHPAVAILKNQIKRSPYTYRQIAIFTGIPEQKIKNMMTGRSDMTLKERDLLCILLDISPVDLVISRSDLKLGMDYLDLKVLPEGMRKSLVILYTEMLKAYR